MSRHKAYNDLLQEVRRAQSLRPALKLDSIFVQGERWDKSTISVVQAELERVFHKADPSWGVASIKVLPHPKHKEFSSNRAFVNFRTERDASRALAHARSSSTVCGEPIKMMYSAKDQLIKDDEEVREMLTVVIRNLSSNIGLKVVEQKFQHDFGEILRSHLSPGSYDTGQALIQFIDASAAKAALAASEAREIRLQNCIITVEPYRRRVPANGYGSTSYDNSWDDVNNSNHNSSHGVAPSSSVYETSPSQRESQQAYYAYEDAIPEALPEPLAPSMPSYNDAGSSSMHGGSQPAQNASYESALPTPDDVDLNELHDNICCPITHEPFKDPVMAPDGRVYERAAIEDWLSKSRTSPYNPSQMMQVTQLHSVPAIKLLLKATMHLQSENEALKERLNLLATVVNQPITCTRFVS